MSTTRFDLVGALSDEGDRARRDGRYDKARDCFDRALALAARELAPDDPRLVDLFNRIGVLGKFAGDHESAASAYEQALALEEARPVPRLDTIATLWHNIGGLAHARRRFEEAEESARRGLALRRRIRGSEAPEVAADEAALAAILIDRDAPREAMELAERARRVLASEWGEQDHDTIAALAVLAAIFHRCGEVEFAASSYCDVIRAKERALGPRHPELVPTINNVGVLYAQMGWLAEAEAAYLRALRILDDADLTDHPYRLRIESNLLSVVARRNPTDDHHCKKLA